MYKKITDGIKQAMIAKDTDRKEVLKQIKMKADAIAKESKKEMTDEIVVSAINKELKQLNQTYESIKERTDTELYKSTLNKIEILKGFLPEQLSEDEIKSEISKVIAENPSVTGGKLLGLVMKSLKGKADNMLIRKMFEEVQP